METEVILFLLAGATLVTIPFGLFLRHDSAWNGTLRRLSKRRGLHLGRENNNPEHNSGWAILKGNNYGCRVAIEPGPNRRTVCVRVDTSLPTSVDVWGLGLVKLRGGELQPGIAPSREYGGGRLIAGTEHPSEAGPGYFRGPEAYILARMTPEIRRTLLEAMTMTTAEIDAGWLVISGPRYMGLEKLESALDRALSLAGLFQEGDLFQESGDRFVDDPQADSTVTALVKAAYSDPNAAFRHRCFECLVTDAARRQAAEQMVQHDLPETRLIGATSDVVKWAHILIECVEGPHPSSFRMRAVEALGGPQAPPEVRAKLAEWISDPQLWESRPSLAVAITEACLHAQAVISYEAMQGLIGAHGVELDRVFAACLGSTATAPWPEAEALLLQLLESDDESVATKAVESLTSRGTVAAVHPLMTRSEGFTRGTDLKTAARAAIAAIQARAGAVQDGGLALTDDPEKAGGVAIADADET